MVDGLNVGGHLSLGRDPRSTVEWADENGYRSMQIFASNPAAWAGPMVEPGRWADFARARNQHNVNPLFIHSIYLINLASDNPNFFKKSRASLKATLRAGSAMEAAGVVTHIGSHGGRGFETVLDQIANALTEIVDESPNDIDLVLENNAGMGGCIGMELDEIAALVERSGGNPRLKVALDTAHLCAAGWDFPQAGVATELVLQVERNFGMERVVLIHANDSKMPLGSHRDRHANIGEGHIGLEGFRQLLAEPQLRALPWILETPDLETRIEDLTNLHALAVQPLTPLAANG